MKVNVYVNWDYQQVMGDAEADDYIASCADDYSKDDSCFEDWLSDNYTHSELWYLSDEARAEAEKNFLEFCRGMAVEDFERAWDMQEIEI